MKKFAIGSLAALACVTAAFGSAQAAVMLYEEQIAHEEEARIINTPIGGVESKFWFNYRANLNEARKELVSDLRRVSDIEDRRDAWEEYSVELSQERKHYVHKMAKLGVRSGNVILGN